MRGLLIVAFLVLALALLLPVLRSLGRRPAAVESHRGELVKDPLCQTYVVSSRAITRDIDGALTYFCSVECAARYARGERR